MRTARSSSRWGRGCLASSPNFPLGCGPGPDPPQIPPWLWAWTRSPSTSPLVVGLETPLGPDPPGPGTPPCWQNSWHALLKILPCPKLRLRAVMKYFIHCTGYIIPTSFLKTWNITFVTKFSTCFFRHTLGECFQAHSQGWNSNG